MELHEAVLLVALLSLLVWGLGDLYVNCPVIYGRMKKSCITVFVLGVVFLLVSCTAMV